MELHQEAGTVSRKLALWTLLVTLAISAAFVLLAWFLTELWTDEARAKQAHSATQPLPSQVNQMELSLIEETEPAMLLQQAKRQHLHSYGWVDRDRKTVHVPIEAAMRLYLERAHTADAPGEEP